MNIREQVAQVRRLSDEALLAGLDGALSSSRKLMAVVIAHLGEVEERRLALLAGHESMFAYCTGRLGMSEDEACRRIEVARLARRFPILFEQLADGRISLSVAALLKAHLDEANHVALLGAVSGKTVTRAREVLAAWFPRPDVAASIRKLPARRADGASTDGAGSNRASGAESSPPFEPAGARQTSDARSPSSGRDANTSTQRDTPAQPSSEHEAHERPRAAPPSLPRKPFVIEPLSPERYRVQFTADVELKRKLDLARDLLRHAVPSGDLATIVGRALDLLIEKTLQRRFGQTQRKPATKPSTGNPRAPSSEAASSPPASTASKATAATTAPPATPANSATTNAANSGATSTGATSTGAPSTGAANSVTIARDGDGMTPASRPSRHLPNETRRAVLERDGLRCTWQGPDGTRCNSRAWLEHDHAIPRGLGGSDHPENVRLYCRAHNRLAAEQAYGQSTITRIIAGRRGKQPPCCKPLSQR